MSAETIIKELSTLSPTDLKTIKAHIDYLCKNGKSIIIKSKTSNLKNYILLCAKRYVDVPDVSILEKYNNHHMDDRLESAAQAIEKLGKELKLDRRQLLKLCQIIVEATVLKVKNIDSLPLVFNTMINFMIEPKILLEENFPGYFKLPVFRTMVLG